VSAVSLPRYYADEEPPREREVALYIDGKYAARGAASAGRASASYGFPSWNETVSPGRLTWERDQNPHGRDRIDLCWTSGERLSSEEFLRWLASAE
jgi:hypothetical protein